MAKKRANGEGNIKTYLDAADKRGLSPMFYLELVTGLRRGEITALLWSDLDIQNKTISVSKQYVKNPNGELTLSRPKTETSVRKGSIPQEAVAPHFDPHLKVHFYSKKAPKTEVFDAFWSCWADSNRRPHPYQVIKYHPAVAAQGFAGVFAAKRMRSETLCSMCSVRSFSRVGHGVGQSHRHHRCGSTFTGSGMVTFCAAGNNKKVSKRRHRATGRSAMLPPDGSAGFRYGSKCGSKRFQRIKKRRQNIVDDRTYDDPVGILVVMH